MNVCRAPKTSEEFEKYFQLRWQMLRKPWKQVEGSEQDTLEDHSIHRMIIDENKRVLAVGRLDQSKQSYAQIRFMAVKEGMQGGGLGKTIIHALETQAQKFGVNEIRLNAREQAVSFYEKLGYQLEGFSHLLFDEIKHFLMIKKLPQHTHHQQKSTNALQHIWHKTIPMSKAMNLLISYYDQQTFITHCDNVFNRNIHNTMFAGSIYTQTTLTGWGWIYLQMELLNFSGDIVLAKGEINYHTPVTGVAHAQVISTNVEGDLSRLSKGRKAKIKLDVHLLCGENVAATFTGTYVILSKNNLPKP